MVHNSNYNRIVRCFKQYIFILFGFYAALHGALSGVHKFHYFTFTLIERIEIELRKKTFLLNYWKRQASKLSVMVKMRHKKLPFSNGYMLEIISVK
ncbi:hypothetical protein BFT35_08300 [Thermoanaerobacterium thermosaccharolyticum]|nr:hypothetical protein BFT35_08300 [Thermoanaerobacterium thermosaccharolyticum]